MRMLANQAAQVTACPPSIRSVHCSRVTFFHFAPHLAAGVGTNKPSHRKPNPQSNKTLPLQVLPDYYTRLLAVLF